MIVRLLHRDYSLATVMTTLREIHVKVHRIRNKAEPIMFAHKVLRPKKAKTIFAQGSK